MGRTRSWSKQFRSVGLHVGPWLITSHLGNGSFGQVFAAKHMLQESEIAIKLINREGRNEAVLAAFQRESMILESLAGHPNVIKLMETFSVDRFHCIGLELAACDLATYLFNGLAHLWEFRVVHSDIKLENLLLDSARQRLMIGDFGISRVLKSDDHCFTGLCGTLAYAAPELLGEKAYGHPIDVWAGGVCLFLLMVGQFPFSTASYALQRSDILCMAHEKLLQGEAASLAPVFKAIFTLNPATRPTAWDVLDHVWFQQSLPADTTEFPRPRSAGRPSAADLSSDCGQCEKETGSTPHGQETLHQADSVSKSDRSSCDSDTRVSPDVDEMIARVTSWSLEQIPTEEKADAVLGSDVFEMDERDCGSQKEDVSRGGLDFNLHIAVADSDTAGSQTHSVQLINGAGRPRTALLNRGSHTIQRGVDVDSTQHRPRTVGPCRHRDLIATSNAEAGLESALTTESVSTEPNVGVPVPRLHMKRAAVLPLDDGVDPAMLQKSSFIVDSERVAGVGVAEVPVSRLHMKRVDTVTNTSLTESPLPPLVVPKLAGPLTKKLGKPFGKSRAKVAVGVSKKDHVSGRHFTKPRASSFGSSESLRQNRIDSRLKSLDGPTQNPRASARETKVKKKNPKRDGSRTPRSKIIRSTSLPV